MGFSDDLHPPTGKNTLMFRGSSAINLDAKGRLAMPSRYREELDERCEGRMVLTIDLAEPCLCLYPLNEWTRIETQLSRMPSMLEETRRLLRLLVGNAVDLELDGNGRFLVPPLLREHAGLGKKVLLVGQLHKFQVWDEAAWNRQAAEDLAAIKHKGEMPDELRGLVF